MNKLFIPLFVLLLTVGCREQPVSDANTHEPLTIEAIEREMLDLIAQERELGWGDTFEQKHALQDSIRARFEHHLANRLTFDGEMPNLEEEVYIEKTSDGELKFYSLWLSGGGITVEPMNFVQWIDRNGDCRCVQLWETIRYPRAICGVWDFEVGGSRYVAIKSYLCVANGCWGYYLDIVKIISGFVYHYPQFFPEGVGGITTYEECFAYNKRGEYINYGFMEAGHIRVCSTWLWNSNIDFDFDPETLTVTVWDDADTEDNRTGATTKSTWKLNIPKTN